MWDVAGAGGRRMSSLCSEYWVTPRNIWSSTTWWFKIALVDSSGDLITIYNMVSKGTPSASYKQLTYNCAFETLPSVSGQHFGLPCHQCLKSWWGWKPPCASLWAGSYMWYLLNDARSPLIQNIAPTCLFCYQKFLSEDHRVSTMRRKPFWEPFL